MRIRMSKASVLFEGAFARLHAAPYQNGMTDISRRIREIRKRLRENQAEFAQRLGVTQSTISKWEAGTHIPETSYIITLAELGGYEVGELIDYDDHAFRKSDWGITATVLGNVQAGEWVEAVEWDVHQQFQVQIPTPVDWPDVMVHGFVVKGTSMDLVYPEGSIVFAVSTIAYDIHPGPGDRVVVQRVDESGLFEVTLKELKVGKDGKLWLWPRSSDPEFQSPIQMPPPGDSQVSEITITGLVVASFTLERTPRLSE